MIETRFLSISCRQERAFRTYRLDREAQNYARRTALETIRQKRKFRYTIQEEGF